MLLYGSVRRSNKNGMHTLIDIHAQIIMLKWTFWSMYILRNHILIKNLNVLCINPRHAGCISFPQQTLYNL